MTSKVTIYHIPNDFIAHHPHKSAEGCCVNIIDTPGFGDTRGAVWDKKIANMIGTLLKSLFTLDYICLVVKSTENRVMESTKFVYAQIQNLYAEDLNGRIMGMFTFTDGGEPPAYEAVKASGIDI